MRISRERSGLYDGTREIATETICKEMPWWDKKRSTRTALIYVVPLLSLFFQYSEPQNEGPAWKLHGHWCLYRPLHAIATYQLPATDNSRFNVQYVRSVSETTCNLNSHGGLGVISSITIRQLGASTKSGTDSLKTSNEKFEVDQLSNFAIEFAKLSTSNSSLSAPTLVSKHPLYGSPLSDIRSAP